MRDEKYLYIKIYFQPIVLAALRTAHAELGHTKNFPAEDFTTLYTRMNIMVLLDKLLFQTMIFLWFKHDNSQKNLSLNQLQSLPLRRDIPH